MYLEPPTGSAILGTDWDFAPNSSREITFNPGEYTKTFTIDILSDGQIKETEKIAFRIARADNATIGTQGSATLQIFDADGLFTDTNVPISAKPTAIWGDYNNDGKLDILGNNRIYDNTRIYDNNSQSWNEYGFSELSGRDSGYGPAWADYNNDGWLDATRLENNGNNIYKYEIYRSSDNDYGGGKDFSLDAVLRDNLSSAIVRSSWADYNNDGRPDLLIGTQGSYSNDPIVTTLYRNTGAIAQDSFQDKLRRS